MIVFKSPALTVVAVEKKDLKNLLKKIIEDLKLNITQTLMLQSNKIETKKNYLIKKLQ